MNIGKFTTIICLLAFVVINIVMLSSTIADESQPQDRLWQRRKDVR